MPTTIRLFATVVILTAAAIPARAADACSLLTTAQVTAAMGTPVKPPTPGPKNCVWSAVNGKGNTYLSLRDTTGYDKFKSTAQMTGQLVPVSGLGDDAFFVGEGNDPTLYVKKGSTVALLRSRITGNTAAQNQAIEKTLAAQFASQL